MKITGIIAEYNPLHQGHQFHIQQTRQLFSSDAPHYIITVLSGDFVQRGLPAILDKHTRTRMALEAGSDLVLELPTSYALSSGERFAFGGVSMLEQLGCVDHISFGTEEGNIEPISRIAHILQQPSVSYQAAYQTALKQGATHPAAQTKALAFAYPDLDLSILQGHSNNMLALEYIKALLSLQSAITPVTIKRSGYGYLTEELSSAQFASATAIRKVLKENDRSSSELWMNQVPDFVKNLLSEAKEKQRLLYPDDFSLLLHYKLLTLEKEQFLTYRGISQDFANKLCKYRHQFENFTQFSNLLWTKDTTYASVCRNLMYLLLDIKKTDFDVHQQVPYARILGFRKQSSALLSEIKKHTAIPLLTKLTNAPDVLPPDALALLKLDIQSSHIYDSVLRQKSHTASVHELQKQIIIL